MTDNTLPIIQCALPKEPGTRTDKEENILLHVNMIHVNRRLAACPHLSALEPAGRPEPLLISL
jgi:hypothetical protein